MIVYFIKKSWFHILLWIAMFIYFIFAPDVFTSAFARNGKPLQIDNTIPPESDRITFVIEDLESYVKDGENLYNLYGWALIVPEEVVSTNLFVREITLVSDERKYFFSVKSGYRNPGLQSKFTDAGVELETLGFSVLIAEDVIKPGEYRIGFVFRNISNGSAFYWDKPARYLVKTPNTLSLERK